MLEVTKTFASVETEVIQASRVTTALLTDW